jgi:hypothetical protein
MSDSDEEFVAVAPLDMKETSIGGKSYFFDPSMSDAVSKADADMKAEKGEGLKINSAYRTSQQQRDAYRRYQTGQGGIAARPGMSRHEKGLAVDVSNYAEAAPYLKKYGLENPIKGDANHFQFPGAPGAYKPSTDISKARNMVAGDNAVPVNDEEFEYVGPLEASEEEFERIDEYEKPGAPRTLPPIDERKPLESFSRRAAAAVAPYTKHALPFAGAVLGGIAAAPVNLIAPGVAEAVGVALGGAMGIQGQREIEELGGVKREPTKGEQLAGKKLGPVLDAGLDVAMMLGLAPVGTLGPEVLPGIRSVGAPALRSAETAGADVFARKALSEETGVPLTAAQLGQKKSTTYLESQLRRNMWSANEAAAFDAEQQAALQKYGTKVQEETFGGKSDALTAGEVAQERAWKRYRTFQGRASKIYDSIPVVPSTKVDTQNLSNVAKEHLEELGKFESSAVKRILSLAQKSETPAATSTSPIVDAAGRPITTETPSQPTYTWEQLRADQSELGKLIERTPDYNKKRILRDLLGASNDDIAAFAQNVDNPDIAERLAQANKFYRQGDDALPGVKVWRERQIKNMMKTESPEDIGKSFFKASPNQSDIKRLKAAAGPRGFQEIKKSWLEDMLTRGEDQSFSRDRFITAYDKYKRSGNLDVMLSDSEREGLDKLHGMSILVRWSEKMGGNPSGTGPVVINNLYKFVRHPVWAVTEAIGAKRLAQNYFGNPEFQQKLIRGLSLPPASARAKAVAGQLAKLAGVEEREQLR